MRNTYPQWNRISFSYNTTLSISVWDRLSAGDYNINKNLIIIICLAKGLTLSLSQDLLNEMGYTLNHQNRDDFIILNCIDILHNVKNESPQKIQLTNNILLKNKCRELTKKSRSSL